VIDRNARRTDRNKLIALGAVAAVIALMAWQRGCHAQTNDLGLPHVLGSMVYDGRVPEWKKDLIRQATLHGGDVFEAHCLFYHPKEAGSDWRRWAGTATGTLVRPGVASCTQANRDRWLGAWVWFEGYGVAHVEDVFPESSDSRTFDLAVWAQPDQNYSEWLSDPTRVAIARDRNVRSMAVVLKPPGGWANRKWRLPR